MKSVSNFLYSLKQGIKGIFSNKTMSFISMISVTAVLVILGTVISMVLNINYFISETKNEINEIRVSVKAGLEESYVEQLKQNISEIDGIKAVNYKEKEDSFNEMKDNWGEDAYLLEGIQNPLDDYYVVTVDSTKDVKSIEKQLAEVEGITEVKYHQDIMQNFLNISDAIKKFGSVIIVFLLLICLLLISNTIKARVYSKKDEIQIIKYVGGSNNFIIAPFVVEGFTIGIIGAILAVLTCMSTYGYMIEKINVLNSSIIEKSVLPLSNVYIYIVITLLVIGIGIGVLGSIISVKKHLKV